MPLLYCAKDGEEYLQSHAVMPIESFEGEGITVTKGSLIDGCLCDKCDVLLKLKEVGYLICFWLPHMEEDFAEYDFAYEREYLEFEKKDITLFGWEWPTQ